MRVAIAQPTYLPWLGYFDLMDQVDTFVLLDNVQFEKQSWQQRNRIKTPTGLQWLTIPVVFRGRLHQKIMDVEIRDAEFSRKHLRALEVNYGRAPFFRGYFPELSRILNRSDAVLGLANLNHRLIAWFMRVLGIRTRLVLASSLGQQGRRAELLAKMCENLGATEYLSPIGSAGYLVPELSALSDRGVQTAFHNYTHPEYRQLFPPFVPFASTIDLIFNEGDSSMQIIRRGRNAALQPQQVIEEWTGARGA